MECIRTKAVVVPFVVVVRLTQFSKRGLLNQLLAMVLGLCVWTYSKDIQIECIW